MAWLPMRAERSTLAAMTTALLALSKRMDPLASNNSPPPTSSNVDPKLVQTPSYDPETPQETASWATSPPGARSTSGLQYRSN